MGTIYVWVLVIYMSGHNSGGPAIIDNISTKEECVRVQQVLQMRWSRCVEVQKKVVAQ